MMRSRKSCDFPARAFLTQKIKIIGDCSRRSVNRKHFVFGVRRAVLKFLLCSRGCGRDLNMYLKCTTVQTCKTSTSQQKATVMTVLNTYLQAPGRSFKVRFILSDVFLTFSSVRFLNARSVAQFIMSASNPNLNTCRKQKQWIGLAANINTNTSKMTSIFFLMCQ